MRNLFINLSFVVALACLPEIIQKTSYPKEFTFNITEVSNYRELVEKIRYSYQYYIPGNKEKKTVAYQNEKHTGGLVHVPDFSFERM